MDGTRHEPLTDSALDREIEAAIGIEPSPEFLARVRTRIATEPQATPWRLGVVSAFRRTSVEPLWGVAIVGIVLTLVVPRFMREGVVAPVVDRSTLARKVSEGPAGVEQQPIRTGPTQLRRIVPDRTESQRTVPLQLSPVLFAEEDQRAFAVFVTAVTEGRVPEDVMKRPEQLHEMVTLSIEPLVVAPLPPLARAVQEGEGQWE